MYYMNDKDIINGIIKKQSLDIFRIGCDIKNFDILKRLVSKKILDMDTIIKLYGVSKMPANRRINLMADVGLVKRINKKHNIKITALGMKFIDLISNIQIYLKEGIIENLEGYRLKEVK